MDIISAAHRYRMFDPGDTVLVAVSGGMDSVAMLHVLHTHRRKLDISLHVAHLNHGIRGEQSNLDEQFVRDLAHGFHLPISVERADVPALKEELGVGEEEAARIVRYEFLDKVAAGLDVDKIAVGHNADDRAESVLFNVLRGTGVDGLGSIRPVRGKVVRPLIDTPRSSIEAYVAENKLPYRVDESNMDVSYSRNRIRHELLPLLERDYNPQIRTALLRLAEIAAANSEFVRDSAQTSANAVSRGGAMDVGLFLELPGALRYEILRLKIGALKGDLKDVAFEQIERVIDRLQEGDDFTITLPTGRIYAVREGNAFRVEARREPPEIKEFEYDLAVPGITRIEHLGLILEAELCEDTGPRKTPPNEVLIDARAVEGKLLVRNIRPGDRIVPFGMRGSKKLQDVFVDKKIAAEHRARAAVVTDDEKVLWVVGVVSSEACRVGKGARQVFRLATSHAAENSG